MQQGKASSISSKTRFMIRGVRALPWQELRINPCWRGHSDKLGFGRIPGFVFARLGKITIASVLQTAGSPSAEEHSSISALDLGTFSCRMNILRGVVSLVRIRQINSFAVGLALMLSAVCAAQNDVPPAGGWPDLSGDWAMIQVLVATADLPIVGEIWIDTTVGAFTHVTQSGSSLILEDRYCFTDAKPSTFLFRTNIADTVMQSIYPVPRVATLSVVDCDIRFSQDWHTEIRGAVFDDPKGESLPTDPDDTRLVDLEGDGHPGMTIQASILGLFSGEGYAVQRYRYQLAGTVFDANTIVGFIDWTSEQSLVEATNPLFMETFTDSTDPDPSKHRFVMIRVDDTWNCQTLRDELPRLLGLLDF